MSWNLHTSAAGMFTEKAARPVGVPANRRVKVSENFAQFCHLALFYNLRLTVWRLAKVAIFTANMFAEH
jgi:hypothetical protein